MNEPRHSGRADGRGWGGRGDAGRRRGEPRRGGVVGGRRAGQRPLEDRSAGGGAPLSQGGGEASGDNPLRGPGESPWVRVEQPQAPRERSEPSQPQLPDLSTLLVLLEGLRGMVPRELTTQFNALLRELLLTLRSLIDWYLERLDGGRREPEVEDIPID
jgi:hypothetical protein